ncbi:hypothetical protein Pfo_031571 [Paulownia fortunei]|nr:hypothetical protein Pfo_031571 [Paulownia fortunei]
MVKLIEDGTISTKQAKQVFEAIMTGEEPEAFAKAHGLVQLSDPAVLLAWITEVLDNNPQSIEDFKGGKDRATGYLIGQLMKMSKGQANPGNMRLTLLCRLTCLTMKRARIIYNPTSGREAIKREMLDILSVYEKAGYETSAFATTPEPMSAAKEAKRAAEEGFDLIVAAGGDGTINEVVNGLSPLKQRPMMAVIPAGTTNDYARALKLPRDEPLEAAKVILQNETIKMDIGQIDKDDKTKYFMNIAALGTISEVTYAVPSLMNLCMDILLIWSKVQNC